MAEQLSIVLDPDNGQSYDKALRQPGILKEAGNLTITTKDKATLEGNAGAIITFSVEMPDGSIRPVQAVTTVKLLKALGRLLNGRYPN